MSGMRNILIALLLSITPAFAQELKTITAEEFIAAKPSPERKEIVKFITAQFDNKQVNQHQLQELWNELSAKKSVNFTRFQIINKILYADDAHNINDARFKALYKYLQQLINKYAINDVDFIVYTGDTLYTIPGWEEKMKNLPLFMMSKNLTSPHEQSKFLLPDEYMIGNWHSLFTNIAEANPEHSWNHKIDKLFWRGSGSGGTYSISNFDKLDRLKLTIFSKLYPDLIDARLVNTQYFHTEQDGHDLKKAMEILFGNDDQPVKPTDHLKYKYLVSVDGNTCAWARVPWIMSSNSVLVKQETTFIEWFYPAIKPYVHYVPVNTRLTDLFSQLEWMKNHDAEVKQIAMNANNFIKNDLMPEDIEAHMVIILNEYHKIQKDNKLTPSLPTIEEIYNREDFIKPPLWKRVRSSISEWFKDRFQ